ncbi:viperin family antiviral radical SAM protein [Shewanella sp. 4t3-1-2LB]|uniref:viperin family antiviral radical SAM protein n=1 Tax=Shewanella sp. 4t3-1-2LB TaxID=2817682 RepID=UPI001A999797|nr:viperin family antiviral radical SAM protein [Shewanella sp. 4t3-1-2LB]MBO1270263.1 viperin family antiviral radical SAM protein [Shewanella sp. 4t3-1-2LB]
MKIQELVINYHMTETCNFRCDYCYATWEGNTSHLELHHDFPLVQQLLKKLAVYFLVDNPLKASLGYSSVRINFAGGEPVVLGSRFVNAVLYAKQLGFNTSIITNGHLLTEQMLNRVASSTDMLGISFDTADHLIAQSIGRIDRKKDWLSPERLKTLVAHYRTLNANGRVKLNTVVNAFNWRENLTEVINEIQPYKWKLLRVLPVYSQHQAVTSEEFTAYILRHRTLRDLIVAEDNQHMWQSYLMINPVGCFYQNIGPKEGHIYSPEILNVGVEHAFSHIEFNPEIFAKRYQKVC